MLFSDLAMQKAQDYWQGSYVHPFIKELQDGSLSDDIFRYYLLQDRYYLEHFSNIFGLLAQKTNNPQLQKIMQENAENMALGELVIRQDFFKKLHITQKEVEQTPIAPTAYHYVSHIYRQLIENNAEIAFASLLPCPWLYYDIGIRLSQTGSPREIYQAWIDTYTTDELKLQIEDEKRLVNHIYQMSDFKKQKKMIEAFVISAKMEYAFWEMSYFLEKWPLN